MPATQQGKNDGITPASIWIRSVHSYSPISNNKTLGLPALQLEEIDQNIESKILLSRSNLVAKLNSKQGLQPHTQEPFLSGDDIIAAVTVISLDNSQRSVNGYTA